MSHNSPFEAAHKGDFEYLKSKLDEERNLLKESDSNQRMLIHWAVLSGNVKLVTYLIELGSPINPMDDTDMNPLILSSSAGHTEIVRMILDRCDDVNHKNQQGHSALQYAASKNWVEVYDSFDSEIIRNNLILIFKVCHLLLEHKADVNIADERGSTPLHRAASKGNIDIVKLFLDYNDKLKINQKDVYGNTALHNACGEDRQEVALLLVDKGADPEMKNRDQQTALDICSVKLAKLINNKKS